MPNLPISGLTASASNAAATDVLPVVQTTGTGPVKMTVQQMAGGLLGSTTLSGATITADAPVINASQTWNNGAVTFTGLKFNAAGTSDANSASGSLLMDLQVNTAPKFQVTKAGSALFRSGAGATFYRASDDSVTGTISAQSASGSIDISGGFRFAITSGDAGTFYLSGTNRAIQFGTSDGDGVIRRRAASNIQLGAADVGATTATVTITIAAPGVVSWSNHGLSTGTPVVFTTTGALPTGITSGTTYYAVVVTTSTFQIASSVANAIAATPTVITTSGSQSGTHTGTRYNITQRLSMQSVTGVTDRLGADLIITGSQGTGTGPGGSIIFQVAPAGTTGATQNALATALTIDSARKLTFADAGAQAYIDNNGKASFYSGRFTAGSGFASPWVTITDNTLGVNLSDAAYLSWCNSSSASSGTADVRLYRDDANKLALRNGTNAQTFNVYGTYTDGSNYERLRFSFPASGPATIISEAAGTGAARPLTLAATGSSYIQFNTAANDRWYINSSGHFLANTDNLYDIGASGATRPRNIYAAGSGIFGGASDNTLVVAGGGANAAFAWVGKTLIYGAETDGNIRLSNNAGNNFGRLQFGGTSASFPALKRSSASLIVRLADDTANAALESASLKTDAPTGGTAATWKLGVRVAATTLLDTTQYIEVDVGGTLYKLAVVTT